METVVILWLVTLTAAVIVVFACVCSWTRLSGPEQRRKHAVDQLGAAICNMARAAAEERVVAAGLASEKYARSGWLHADALDGDRSCSADVVAYLKFYEQERERVAKEVVAGLLAAARAAAEKQEG